MAGCSPRRAVASHQGMRNRIAHNYWTIDDDVVWTVVNEHAPMLRQVLAQEVKAARRTLGPDSG
jgi:uncharacterized protein with HEPN domain